MTTNRQKAAVHFCEQWLNVTYNGDINNFQHMNIESLNLPIINK